MLVAVSIGHRASNEQKRWTRLGLFFEGGCVLNYNFSMVVVR